MITLSKPLIRKRLTRYFRSRPEIRLGYLFGSQATGRENAASDIDVAILTDEKKIRRRAYGYKADVLTDLMKLLKTDRVDLVLLNEAPYFLRHRVIRYGENLYRARERERIAFQVDTMTRYPDLKRLLEVHF